MADLLHDSLACADSSAIIQVVYGEVDLRHMHAVKWARYILTGRGFVKQWLYVC